MALRYRVVHWSILCDPTQPSHRLADPTQPNPTQIKFKNLDPTLPNPLERRSHKWRGQRNKTCFIWTCFNLTLPAARQGLAVLMASASVVLKNETSTFRQRHNFISFDLKFGVSDYVREVTSPDKFGSGPMSGRDATWGQYIRVLWLFIFYFFYSSTELQPIPVNQC